MDITRTLTGALAGTLIIAAILAAPFAFSLIGLYRHAVIRLMRKHARSVPASSEPPVESKQHPSPLTTKPEFVSLNEIPPIKNEATIDLYGNLRRRHWQAAAVYITGGLCFATLLTIAFLLSKKIEITPLRFLYNGLASFWPTVLVINLVVPLERRNSYMIYAAYLFAWLVMTEVVVVLNPVFSWGQAVYLWLLYNLLPTMIVVMFLYRRIRAVGSMVFTFLAFGLTGIYLQYQENAIILQSLSSGKGLAGWLYSGLSNLGLGPYGAIGFMLIVNILLMAVLGWLTLQLLKWLYLHKRQSSQSLVIDPIWFIFGYFTSALMVFENPWWILSFIVAFVLYKIITWTGFYFLNRKRRNLKGPELLLLRVFSLGKRSEQLYSAIAKAWRYVGNIHFIIGPDLATSTVEPHNFLDYISGRLRHHFIDSAETLEQRITSADEFPDLDGRYRIHDFFCYDDTWKMVLSRLAKDCDAILMDLRNFSQSNAGCVFEISELVNFVPLKRVVFVVDQTTDETFLRESVENAWRRLSADSPNRDKCTEIHLFHYSENRPDGLHQLLYALSVAATPG